MNTINRKISNQAFSLVELLAAMVITVIVASIATLEYRQYVNKAKINSMWEKSEGAKLAIESDYLKKNSDLYYINVNSETTSYTTPDSDFIKCITIQNGIISVVGNPTKFNNKDIWISWTPYASNGILTWYCDYSSDAAKYLIDTAPECNEGTAAFSADSACN